MNQNKTTAKLFGIFFILAFISYATGVGLIEAVINNFQDFRFINSNKNQIFIGAILITVCHTFANIGLLLIMFSIFKDRFSIQAYVYLSATLTSTIFLAIGGIALTLIVPLAEQAMDKHSYTDCQLFGKLLQKAQFYFYQFGMILWSVGGLFLCNMLLKTKVVVQWLSIWGFMGYIVFLIACLLEVFGIAIGTTASVIGGLFEIILSFMLIFRGFRNQASLSE